MHAIKKFLYTWVIITFPVVLYSQIDHGTADFRDQADYVMPGGIDSVFIYNTSNADPMFSFFSTNGDSITFNLSRYVPGVGYVDFATILDDTIIIDTLSSNMGYRIITPTDTFRIWIMFNDFDAEITTTDADKKIPTGYIYCEFISFIEVRIDSARLNYYNPETGAGLRYSLNYLISWTSNQEEAKRPRSISSGNFQVLVDKPYWEDTWYIAEITDAAGLIRSDSAFYESIEPHAEFEDPKLVYLNDTTYYPNKNDRYYEIYDDDYNSSHTSAPALFMFINQSVNADSLVWIFGDSTITGTSGDTIVHTYIFPGTYYAKLVAIHYADFMLDPCYDTFPNLEEEGIEITVDDWEIDGVDPASDTKLPNVFTPEGENPYWRFPEDVSLTFFEIAIYNRFGRRVYHYEGNIRDWEGWDGKYKGSNKLVSSGVYFYVVKQLDFVPYLEPGLKNEKIPDKVYNNYIHVFSND